MLANHIAFSTSEICSKMGKSRDKTASYGPQRYHIPTNGNEE